MQEPIVDAKFMLNDPRPRHAPVCFRELGRA